MQWWCSADGQAWTWDWVAYPGVWAVVLGLAFIYHRLVRNAPEEGKKSVRFGWIGIACIWISLDWPLGPIAAGYLASAHAFQFLLIAFVAVPLILLGLNGGAADRIPTAGFWGKLFKAVTFPVVAAGIFNVIIIATHTPAVVDSLMVTQWGAFLNDLLWFIGAMVFWWPVIVSVPYRPRFHGFFQVVYIFLGTSFHTVIGIMMLIRRYPLYSVYELAPPMTSMSALRDLQIAGGIMELLGSAIVFPLMSVIFFKWVKKAEHDDAQIDAELERKRVELERTRRNKQEQGLVING